MRSTSWLLCTALALPAALVPATALAQSGPNDTRAQARAAFQAGVAAYQRGEYASALSSFQDAYRIAPNPVVHANLANCYMQMNQPIEALEHFETFLRDAHAAAPAQRHEIEGFVRQMRAQIAEVHVRVIPEAATDPILALDGRPTSSSSVVRMMPGHHSLEASADGYAAQTTAIDATAGMQTEVVVRLRRPSQGVADAAATGAAGTTGAASTSAASGASAASAGTSAATTGTATSAVTTASASGATSSGASSATTSETAAAGSATGVTPAEGAGVTEPHDERPHGLRPTYFFIAAGVTGVALISTVTFGALALSANGQFNDDATRIQMGGGDVASLQAQGHDAASRARTMALVSDVSLAVTGAAAVATVVLLTQTRFAAAPVTVSPVVGANGGGLALSGRF